MANDSDEKVNVNTEPASPAEDPFDFLSIKLEKELEATGKHTLAAEGSHFQTEPGHIRAEINTVFTEKGFATSNATVLTGVMNSAEIGSLSVGATGALNNQAVLSEPKVQARYTTPTLIDQKDSNWEAVAAIVASSNIPTADRAYTGDDVAFAVSGVLINKVRGATLTGSVITNANGVIPTLWGAASENIYEDKNARLAANLNGGYNLNSKQGGVGAGLFVDYKLGANATLYGSTGFLVNNVGRTNDVLYTAGLGLEFGAAPAPAKESSAAVLQPESAIATVTSAASASNPAAKNLDYNFRDLSEKDQQKVLMLMAETYQKINPDVSTKEARSIILNELAVAKYHVDAHGTKSFEDDTPQRVEAYVASR
jgi:hypothetical protein